MRGRNSARITRIPSPVLPPRPGPGPAMPRRPPPPPGAHATARGPRRIPDPVPKAGQVIGTEHDW